MLAQFVREVSVEAKITPKAEGKNVVLRIREKHTLYPRKFHFEGIFTKAIHWFFVIVGVLFSMLVLRALIRGVHSDDYSSPTWIFQLSDHHTISV